MNSTTGNVHQMANNNMAMVPITSSAYRPMGTSHVMPNFVPSKPAIPTFPMLAMPQYVVGSTPGYAMTASGIPYGINVPAGTIVHENKPLLPLVNNTAYQHPGFLNSGPKEVAPGVVLINGQLFKKMPQTPPVVPARPNVILEHQHNTNHDDGDDGDDYDDDGNNCATDNLLDIGYDDLEIMFRRMNSESQMSDSNCSQPNKPVTVGTQQRKQVRFMDEAMGRETFDETRTNRRLEHARLKRISHYNPETAPPRTSTTVNNDAGTTTNNASKHEGPKPKPPLKRTSQFYV